MGCKRRNVVQPPVKIVLAESFQCHGIDLHRQSLFAEGQKSPPVPVNTDIRRRLEHDPQMQLVLFKRGPECSIEWPAGGLLVFVLSGSHESVRESNLTLLEVKAAQHSVAIEPVPVTQSGFLETCRAVDVIVSLQPGRDLAGGNLECIGIFSRLKKKPFFDQRGQIWRFRRNRRVCYWLHASGLIRWRAVRLPCARTMEPLAPTSSLSFVPDTFRSDQPRFELS